MGHIEMVIRSKMTIKRSIYALTILLLLLSGCMTKEIPPTQLTAIFQASYGLNPNSNDKPSPIIVRIYELKTLAQFQNSNFFALYDDDLKALAADMISRDELEFRPGEERTIKRELDPATRFLGLIAAYRDLENAQWRVATKITPQQSHSFIINLARAKISIEPAPQIIDAKPKEPEIEPLDF